MRGRTVLTVVLLLLVAVVIQTTLFGRIELVTPDLVLLLIIILCLTRIRPEVILAIAFTSGLMIDLLGPSALGLRAVVYTTVAYLGIRTRDRAEIGRVAVALWAGALTLIGVILLMLIGTLFGQSSLLGENALNRADPRTVGQPRYRCGCGPDRWCVSWIGTRRHSDTHEVRTQTHDPRRRLRGDADRHRPSPLVRPGGRGPADRSGRRGAGLAGEDLLWPPGRHLRPQRDTARHQPPGAGCLGRSDLRSTRGARVADPDAGVDHRSSMPIELGTLYDDAGINGRFQVETVTNETAYVINENLDHLPGVEIAMVPERVYLSRATPWPM